MDLPVENFKFAVVGGDLRQIYTAIDLADKGYEVAIFGFDSFNGDTGLCTQCMSPEDALSNCNAVILPMPVTNDNINLFMPLSDKTVSLKVFFEYLSEKQILLGGRVGSVKSKFDIDIIDYFEREDLTIANAYLTAESAVGIAMEETNESIKDISVLVMGFGRIGKALCNILKGMGVNVYASARKKQDFAWIRAYGYSPIDTSKVCEVISSCKLIFNTIPNLVLGNETLSCIQRDCVIIDLASKPGGVDFEAAKKYGLKVLWALGLPGTKLPVSAGRVQAKTIIDILEDMEAPI